MTTPVQIWCDASVDPECRLAFGAYMVIGMKRPIVLKLKEKRSFDAEVELMTKALLKFPKGSTVMTDLQHLSQALEKWDYYVVSRFKEVLIAQEGVCQYCPPEQRPSYYRLCHQSAYGRLRNERGPSK